MAGKLNEVTGIVIGKLVPCAGETENDLLKACFDVFKDLNVPVIYNVHAGHIKNPLTLPTFTTTGGSKNLSTTPQ